MLKRKTPLRRTGIKRSKGLRRHNPERAAKRRAECFGEQAELCRQLPCLACSDWPLATYKEYARRIVHEDAAFTCVSDPHHEPPRSCGGRDSDTVPLCRAHHDERHRVGRRAFESRYSLDLRQCARMLAGEIAECE